MTDTVRILIPDHPDLAIGRAIDFAASLRHANDPEDGEGGWSLPAPLVDPALQAALGAVVLHDWHRHVGRDGSPEVRTEIGLIHAGVEHMGLYIATATRDQLALLAAALEVITGAETTDPNRRTPEQCEITEFVREWRESEKTEDPDASLSAWIAVVRILALAVATAPGPRTDHPMWLYDPHGVATPTPNPGESTLAADTLTLLERTDAAIGNGERVDLDEASWHAWQRLVAEWHVAVYGPRAEDPDAKLSSLAY